MESLQINKMGGELVETYDHPQHIGENDWRISLYFMPAGNYAIATNGDPIFEGDQEWTKALEEYGIEI